MGKFKVRVLVENPNTLYCDVVVEANSPDEATEAALSLDLQSLPWSESEGNAVDVDEAYTNIEDVEAI